MKVSISRLHFPITALGPGRRVGLWMQGCSIRCAGCISVDTWQDGEGIVPIEDVIAKLTEHASEADGLTVSGGEPFDQPDALLKLLAHWRQVSKSSTLVFTGREREDIDPWLARNPGLVDAVMTGPFRSDLPQTMALRGSDNQKLHILTPRGEALTAYERSAAPSDRRLDVMFDQQGEAWIAGIPTRGDMGRLRRVLAAAGHRAVTSDATGAFSA